MATSKMPTIWMSSLPGSASGKQLATVITSLDPGAKPAEDDPERIAYEELKKNSRVRGKALPADAFPDTFFENRPHDPTTVTQPFLCGPFWFVHRDLADVLRRFDLGPAVLVPVRFVEPDRTTPLSDDYLILNVGAARATVLPEQSPSIYRWIDEPDRMPVGTPRYKFDPSTEKKGVTCRRSAMEGPPLWLDPDVKDVIFLADPIARALDEAGYRRALKMKPCKLA